MQLTGTVEVDETYIGPRRRRVGDGANWSLKTPVIGLVERNGRAVAFPVERVDHASLYTAIKNNVSPTAHVQGPFKYATLPQLKRRLRVVLYHQANLPAELVQVEGAGR